MADRIQGVGAKTHQSLPYQSSSLSICCFINRGALAIFVLAFLRNDPARIGFVADRSTGNLDSWPIGFMALKIGLVADRIYGGSGSWLIGFLAGRIHGFDRIRADRIHGSSDSQMQDRVGPQGVCGMAGG